MTYTRLHTSAMLVCLFCAAVAHAQQPQPTAAVPKLVRFSGTFRRASGAPAQTMESLTLSVYRDQTGGDALWHEIQNVVVDADGQYSVLMGATQNAGMPLDLFASGEPRWLGVQFNRPGEAEQPRVLLVSVPYALKAVDAETLGGKPASAYLLAAPTVGADSARESSVTAATTAVKPKANPANSGMPNYIGKFINTTDLVDSAMYEVNGNVGIAMTNPLISLDARTGPFPQMGMAQTTDYLTFFASDQYGPAIYWDPAKDMRFGKGGSGLYNPFGFVEYMRIQSSTGNVGIGTITPGSTLDVVGNINFSGSILYQGSTVLQLPPGGGPFPGGNVALGLRSLQANTTGDANTAVGESSLHANTTGSANTAVGAQALRGSVAGDNTGDANTAIGASALEVNTAGSSNTASGEAALYSNTIGNSNTAIGDEAMIDNNVGSYNTAWGGGALPNNTSGSNNTAIGYSALPNNATGNNNIAIGNLAAGYVSGGNSNNIHIFNPGVSGDSGTIRIGTAVPFGCPGCGPQTSFFAAGIRGVTTGNNDAVPVLIDSNGQLGTMSSSRRFKEDIHDMGPTSRDLMRLRPVTYRYKEPFADGSKPIQFGLIAEEVAEVYPDLVAHSADGQIETVKYQVLDSMLLNEMQRQHAEIGAENDEIRRLKQQIKEQDESFQQRIAKLEAALASTSGVARVSGAQ